MGAKHPLGPISAKPRRRRIAAMSGIAWTLAAGVAFAAASTAENIRLANDVVPAPFGYEPIATRYVIAETTSLYVSPYIYPGTVNNAKLNAGQAVDILAKAKGYDWILVGKDGIGIGYIPMSRLAPAKGAQ